MAEDLEKVELLSEDAIATPHEDSTVEQLEQTEDEYKHIIEMEEDNKGKEATYDKLKAPEITPKRCCRPSTYADKVITAVYVLSIICAIVMTVLYFANDETISQFLSMMIVCVTIWVGAVVGMIAISKGFTVGDQTNALLEQNREYYDQLKALSDTRARVLEDLKKTRNNAQSLHAEEEKLTESVAQFGDLVDEFNKMKETFGKSFQNMFSSLNESNSILKGIQNQNHRAKLYAHFYELSKEDKREGLSPEEYKQFLGDIPPMYRDKFDDFGTLDKDHDGNISKIEFENAVAKVLNAMQEAAEP
eukprot:5767_1